jgi:hypothetical protein
MVELLPESSTTTTPTLLRYGFDPGASASKYPAGPGPLPGYNVPDSIESVYLQKLNAGVTGDGILDTAGMRTLYEMKDLILAIGSQLFQDLAGPNPLDRSTTTLSDALNPKRFWLQMITVDGNASLIHRQEFNPPAFPLSIKTYQAYMETYPRLMYCRLRSWRQLCQGERIKCLQIIGSTSVR